MMLIGPGHRREGYLVVVLSDNDLYVTEHDTRAEAMQAITECENKCYLICCETVDGAVRVETEPHT